MLAASLSAFDPSATWAAQDFRSAKVFVRPFGKRDIVPLRCMDMTPTGGSHGNLHPTARIRCHAWQRGCRVAARGARAQQPAKPVIGYIDVTTAADTVYRVSAFREGLKDAGFIDGHNVAIEFRWA